MAEELEIKLSLTSVALARAGAWLQKRAGAGDEGVRHLRNRYFDTPDGSLNRHRIALRVRQDDDRYIQTLKTQGEFVDGAHKRREWEWPLTDPDLKPGLIADTPVGNGIDLFRLAPVFETDFQRRIINLEDTAALVECALDSGHIVAGERRRDLCELELELKGGDAAALLGWARKLAENVPVFLNLISKAEQGYALAGLHRPEPLPRHAAAGNRLLHALSRAWLSGVTDDDLWQALDAVASEEKADARELAWLRDSLGAGKSVSELAAMDPRLGQLQLALV